MPECQDSNFRADGNIATSIDMILSSIKQSARIDDIADAKMNL